jgi:hypothetical protein
MPKKFWYIKRNVLPLVKKGCREATPNINGYLRSEMFAMTSVSQMLPNQYPLQ